MVLPFLLTLYILFSAIFNYSKYKILLLCVDNVCLLWYIERVKKYILPQAESEVLMVKFYGDAMTEIEREQAIAKALNIYW